MTTEELQRLAGLIEAGHAPTHHGAEMVGSALRELIAARRVVRAAKSWGIHDTELRAALSAYEEAKG